MNLRYRIVTAALVALPMAVSAQTTYLSADFSTYTGNAELVGQNGWTQIGTNGNNPLFVSPSGVVAMPGGIQADGQDAFKSFTETIPAPVEGTKTLHLDAVINVTAAGANPSYFLAVQGGTFANVRIAAKSEGSGYVLGVRTTGQAGYPFVYGTQVHTFGQLVHIRAVISMVAGAQNDQVALYAGSSANNLTLQATSVYTSGVGTDPQDYNAVIISQFGSDTVYQSGVAISSVSFSEPASSSVDSGQMAGDSFKLNAAYPNPFNPSTILSYSLRTSNHARLAVYDLLGREVAVLVDGVMPAGDHTATFNAVGLPSGIYLVRLESAGRMATQRITLLK